ncbi:peroxiredoxin [Prauserella marina]|uniref:Osmotically inducible protein OsmC n=1 Tax=Prauserella marina TaxID=530584 RepID=A0A222VX55_9PSEU|nr:OsmC family peroxiredoxin [Prauserella marina]ASR38505.1 peroxiredoxin [Prauserella marina]PWV81801.1 osmotically inducible protein OsmC [Prauserella marina]SDD12605.1 osmotically inducible protein OsmC [Prauserella marina]
MVSRDATTHWTGGLNSGKGTVTLDSSNAGQFDVSFPRRIGDAEGQTSPEELIAAAQSSCLAMNLSAVLERNGHAPKTIDVSAEVTVSPVDGGLSITAIDITLRADVDSTVGIDQEAFQVLAATAKDTCPVSKALSGTTITLDAALT